MRFDIRSQVVFDIRSLFSRCLCLNRAQSNAVGMESHGKLTMIKNLISIFELQQQ